MLFRGNLQHSGNGQIVSIDSGSNHISVNLVDQNNDYIRSPQELFETLFDLLRGGVWYTMKNDKRIMR